MRSEVLVGEGLDPGLDRVRVGVVVWEGRDLRGDADLDAERGRGPRGVLGVYHSAFNAGARIARGVTSAQLALMRRGVVGRGLGQWSSAQSTSDAVDHSPDRVDHSSERVAESVEEDAEGVEGRDAAARAAEAYEREEVEPEVVPELDVVLHGLGERVEDEEESTDKCVWCVCPVVRRAARGREG